MTKQGRRWLGSLVAATVALAAPSAWRELSSSGPRARASSHHEAPALGEESDRAGRRSEQPLSEGQEAGEARQPHPITLVHEAMAKRRELIGALRGALADERYEDARALLGEAEALEKSDPEQFKRETSTFEATLRGYQLILECIAARAAAPSGSPELPAGLREESRRYLDQQRLPPRREVRRVCLEGRGFARRS